MPEREAPFTAACEASWTTEKSPAALTGADVDAPLEISRALSSLPGSEKCLAHSRCSINVYRGRGMEKEKREGKEGRERGGKEKGRRMKAKQRLEKGRRGGRREEEKARSPTCRYPFCCSLVSFTALC